MRHRITSYMILVLMTAGFGACPPPTPPTPPTPPPPPVVDASTIDAAPPVDDAALGDDGGCLSSSKHRRLGVPCDAAVDDATPLADVGPVPPKPVDAAPPPPPPPPTPDAGPPGPPPALACVKACAALAAASCPLGTKADCATFLTRDIERSGRYPNKATGKPLTCLEVQSVHVKADAVRLGFVCQ
jgi:hypothetical protein